MLKDNHNLEFKQKIVCEAVFSTEQTFNAFHHSNWTKAFQSISPGFIFPSYQKIINHFLPIVYDEKVSCIKSCIESSLCASLLIDGWSNTRGESIIEVAVTTPKTSHAHVLDSIYTGSNTFSEILHPFLYTFF